MRAKERASVVMGALFHVPGIVFDTQEGRGGQCIDTRCFPFVCRVRFFVPMRGHKKINPPQKKLCGGYYQKFPVVRTPSVVTAQQN